VDNVKLFCFYNKNPKVKIGTVWEIIDYWYEWIFREEIYEKVVKYQQNQQA
jgi:hypothetical protein